MELYKLICGEPANTVTEQISCSDEGWAILIVISILLLLLLPVIVILFKGYKKEEPEAPKVTNNVDENKELIEICTKMNMSLEEFVKLSEEEKKRLIAAYKAGADNSSTSN